MEARKYSASEIRLMRIFAVALFAFSIFSGIAGVASISKWPQGDTTAGHEISKEEPGKGQKGGKKSYANIPLARFLTSAVFLALSIALGVGITKVVRNGLRDVELDPVAAAENAPENESSAG